MCLETGRAFTKNTRTVTAYKVFQKGPDGKERLMGPFQHPRELHPSGFYIGRVYRARTRGAFFTRLDFEARRGIDSYRTGFHACTTMHGARKFVKKVVEWEGRCPDSLCIRKVRLTDITATGTQGGVRSVVAKSMKIL